jgi:hypothetical protein
MHCADWLTTLASVAGYDVSSIPLPLDGVNLWSSLVAAARGEEYIPHDEDETSGRVVAKNRTILVIGNSTNECTWDADDPRYHGADGVQEAFLRGGDVPVPLLLNNNQKKKTKGKLSCGFAIRMDLGEKRWKLIKNYGGGPDTWCNKSSSGNVCGTPTGHYPWPPRTTLQRPATSTLTCSTMKNICLPGNDIRSFPLQNPASSYEKQCCDACNAEAMCAAFTVNSNTGSHPSKVPTCYLKTTPGVKQNKSPNCVSGTNGRSPIPPQPPASETCPNGFCLFEVMSDPYELHEVSAEHADVVSAMQEKMAQILQSYRQYEEDPACQGKTTFANNSVVGKSWQPWC